MLKLLEGIPDIKMHPLQFIMEKDLAVTSPSSLWLEFGVASGKSINYISGFAKERGVAVYGFDSFEGLPEFWRERYGKGAFSCNGILPEVNSNVILIKGLFNETLSKFLDDHRDEKVSFIHMDCDLYSSTKDVLETLRDRIYHTGCIIVFDELVNYEGFDSDNGELKAFYEFITENREILSYEWIGMNGKPYGMKGSEHQSVGVKIKPLR